MTSSADFYARAIAGTPPATIEGGASGYFSEPSEGLDPSLFEGKELRSEVRNSLGRALYDELRKLGLKNPSKWTYMWLAGSGIGYQWSADRGNGDLDVLFGVDFPQFVWYNTDWGGMSEEQFAAFINTHLKSDLWPRTAHTQFGGRTYEVTFYLSPGVGKDISQINPYAAYDLRQNKWSVTPDVTRGDHSYPAAWATGVGADEGTAKMLIERHNSLADQISMLTAGTPSWHSAGDQLRQNSEQARRLFDDIHQGRHAAFEPGGHGYGDYANYRWQMAKRSGILHGLQNILHVANTATAAQDQELYGGRVGSADEALTRAVLVHEARPGLK